MGKQQQTLWLAGFAGLSAACAASWLTSSAYLAPMAADRPANVQPHALLAANTDHDPEITLTELKQMLEGHFARLDRDSNGLIDRDEYASRHLHLFTSIDSDQNHRLTPVEVRTHKRERGLLHMTAYQ